MLKKQPLFITLGDPKGIGPEVCIKSFKYFSSKDEKISPFIFIGSLLPIKKAGIPYISFTENEFLQNPETYLSSIKKKNIFHILSTPTLPQTKVSSLSGYHSGKAIEIAVRLIQNGFSQALVTGPIHKKNLIQGGFPYSGHTDYLAFLSQTKNVTMMLANDKLRVSLVTTHIPLNQVAHVLSTERISTTILQTFHFLNTQLKIKKPKIYVCLLNPHAGEGGVLGSEEIQKISPTISQIKRKLGTKIDLSGPYASDSLFSKNNSNTQKNRADAIVCMYHDQGLIPLKLLDFNHSVNITLGLPFVRTSVDHGVAFDIVGKNIANPQSMIAAIRLARNLIKS